MEAAIEAAVQIGAAKGAYFPPARRDLDLQTLQTRMAFYHPVTGSIFCRIYLLFSRHIIQASPAGIMQPKMLNQRGMLIPFATIST